VQNRKQRPVDEQRLRVPNPLREDVAVQGHQVMLEEDSDGPLFGRIDRPYLASKEKVWSYGRPTVGSRLHPCVERGEKSLWRKDGTRMDILTPRVLNPRR
jgi:hypothetical protein